MAFFLQILLQLKNPAKNLSVHIILMLDTTYVSNLTFLGFISLEASFGEEKQSPSHPDTQLTLPLVNLSGK